MCVFFPQRKKKDYKLITCSLVVLLTLFIVLIVVAVASAFLPISFGN